MKLLTSTIQILLTRKCASGPRTFFASSSLIGVTCSWKEKMATADSTVTERDKLTLESLKFVNRAIKSLPVEENRDNYVRTVAGACFSHIDPLPLKNPQLVAYSDGALSLLGLASSEAVRPELVEYFSGNKLLPGSEPAAHCYCGHQFGHFSGQLGDGCAVLLGEVETPNGDHSEIQLKGSGKTPYSRHADGRKVLRSSIREFLCSEAMYYLGIPTTRAGTCITSDDYIIRDIHYNGNPIQERATVISRIAPTFLRFGSFEIFKTRDRVTGRVGPSVGRMDILHQLLDYVTRMYYPEIHSAHSEDRVARTAAFFKEICLRTARLVALWQCVGFCHGVLNTDNMSIVGLTIDYGPFGFMDRYDPGHICNGSDDSGRYAYDRQPAICRWNLKKLAEALATCLPEDKAEEILKLYDAEFEQTYLEKMRLKLGLVQRQLPDDSDLIESFLDTMHKTGCDFTNGFQCLEHVHVPTDLNSVSNDTNSTESNLDVVIDHFLKQCSSPQELIKSFKPKMSAHQLQMFATLMHQSPEVLMALGISPDAIEHEISKQDNLRKLKDTSVEKKQAEDRLMWMSWLRSYRMRLVHELPSDTENLEQIRHKRLKAMQENNPRIVLRNHIAQKAIEMAERGDYSEVRRVLKLLESPYESVLQHVETEENKVDKPLQSGVEPEDSAAMKSKSLNPSQVEEPNMSSYFSKPPEWALSLCVT